MSFFLCFGGRRLRLWFSRFFPASSATCFPGCFPGFPFSFSVNLVEINQLDQGCFSVVTNPGSQFDDAGIATRTSCHLSGNGAKEFCYRLLILEVAEYHTALVGCIFLSFCNQWLHICAQSPCLGECGNNAFVIDQLAGQVAQQRLTVR